MTIYEERRTAFMAGYHGQLRRYGDIHLDSAYRDGWKLRRMNTTYVQPDPAAHFEKTQVAIYGRYWNL